MPPSPSRHQPWLRRVAHALWFVVLLGAAAVSPAAEPGPPLAEVLDAWRRDGLAISFSTALVTEDMRVTNLSEIPLDSSAETRLNTVLGPHGLGVES
ncbi:MAG: hypothetical protein AAGE94_15935, partial [Acidobacteriota bacterium]